MRWLAVIAVLAGCGATPPPPAPSAVLVSSPGPLIASHGKLACIDCHLGDSPQIAIAKCTGCHAALVSTVAGNRGLHAKGAVREQACTECHLDHRGARYDARWATFGGVARFDHAITGWKLDAGHRIACEKCHTNAKAATPSFTGATAACASCHPQPHAGTPYAKLACESCHFSSETFKTIAFDHDEKTRPIGTSHRHVACASCHTPQLGAKAPPFACATCHASRDPHNGRFSAFGTPPACEKCHAPSMGFAPGQTPLPAWKPNRFDHGVATGWALVGRHRDITCRSCHQAPGATTFVPLGSGKDCMGCHEHQRVHDRKYPNNKCLQCHQLPGAVWIKPPATP